MLDYYYNITICIEVVGFLGTFRLIWMEKVKFTLDNVIGQPFGGRYEVKNQRLVKVHRKVQTQKGRAF